MCRISLMIFLCACYLVPYRDSTLTYLLQDSLEKNSKVCWKKSSRSTQAQLEQNY